MALQEQKKISVSSHSPLMLYHNLGRTSTGTLLFATNSLVVGVHPDTGVATPILSLKEESISCTKAVHVPCGAQGDAVSLGLVTTAATTTVLGEKGAIATLAFNIATDGLINTAAGSVEKNNTSTVRLIVGTSAGKVFFSQVDAASGTSVPQQPAANSHTAAVTATYIDASLAGGSGFALSGDSLGHIIVWNGSFQQAALITAASPDCVSDLVLLSGGSRLVSSYGSGKLRVFTVAGVCEAEVCAHAQWINSLAYHPQTQLLASTAEDGVLSVWKVAETPDAVPIIFSKHTVISDGVPTGTDFTTGGDGVWLAVYANSTVRLFTL